MRNGTAEVQTRIQKKQKKDSRKIKRGKTQTCFLTFFYVIIGMLQ